MKTYQLLLCMSLCGGFISEINGNGSDFQKPSSKWAWAQSYSWVVSSDGNDFDPLKLQQAQVQQPLQQQAQIREAQIQQAQIQQALHQQSLQQQALQEQASQQKALQQRALQQQAQIKEAQIREAQIREAQIQQAQIQQALQQQSLQHQALQQQAQIKEAQVQQALQQQALQQQALQQQALQEQALQQRTLQQQAQIKEAQVQQALQQQSLQQQALQDQALQQRALQQQALQQQAQVQQALQQRIQKEAVENVRLSPHRSNSVRDYTVNEPTRRTLGNFQSEIVTPLSSRQNDNSQEFINEIVRQVIQETRGEFDTHTPTTRQDIERIVRRILHENSSNLDANRINSNRYRDNRLDSNHNQNSNGMNPNPKSLIETLNPQKSITYPIAPSQPFNPQAECIFNCGNGVNSHTDRDPIAVAMANSFSSLGRSRDPRVIANSFTFTSV